MRVYHFLPSEYGLSDIALRRMKIARFGDLNDPFELLAVNVGGRKNLRNVLRSWKAELRDKKGLLCFSKKWENPVLWSHYAASHTGFCLGFDLNDNRVAVTEVKYSRKRIRVDFNGEPTAADLNDDLLKTLLSTKFYDWSYEDEVRVLVDLNKHRAEGVNYFYTFSKVLVLRQVILGPECQLPVVRVRNLIDSFYDSVDVINARLMFKEFKVVQKKSKSKS